MCRMMVYKGPPIVIGRFLLDEPHSLLRQGSQAKEMLAGPLNADGFGVAWYHSEIDGQPAVYKSTQPIWLDSNVKSMFPRISAGIFMAHVRAASDGMPVSITNTHPFSYGNFSFMHNGFIDGFREKVFGDFAGHIRSEFWPIIKGNTDSEHLFGLWLSQLKDPVVSNLDDQKQALFKSIQIVNQLALRHGVEAILNVGLTDGISALVCRHHIGTRKATLYMHPAPHGLAGSLLIASEALFESPSWQPLPENSLLTIREDGTHLCEPL